MQMITNFIKIFSFCLILFIQNNAYSQSIKQSFDKKKVASYFSSLVSYDNNQSQQFLNFFQKARILEPFNNEYVSKYLISLVLEGKIVKAINKAKIIKNKKINASYETDLLIAIGNLKDKNYEKNFFNLSQIYKDKDKFQSVILNFLEEYTYLFKHNKINDTPVNNFGHLTIINKAFQKCYLSDKNTKKFFNNAINSDEGDYSRYLFFYINFLITEGKIDEAKAISEQIDILGTSLLAAQTKDWINKKKFNNFNEIFSCKSPQDIMGEFFYLIASIYSSEKDIKKSNFYLNISNFLNPKFKFNLGLFAENFYEIGNFELSEFYFDKFQNNNPIYNWYKLKRKAEIIKNKKNSKSSFNFIYAEFNKIKSPSPRVIFDMANIAKNFEKYDLSIKYYSKILLNLKQDSLFYADILYRRGSCYERLGNFKKSDIDFLNSLKINEDSYTLNYLAYSWLERNYKVDAAIQMLEKANKQNKDDPYIIDSVGWGYYLTQDYIRAEVYLRRAVRMMPNDPTVNDHYGDVLWKLQRGIEANYFWKNVLTFEDTKDEMKNNINLKLLKGIAKI
jgi:tetratricopeptide (TPR) repeat protein